MKSSVQTLLGLIAMVSTLSVPGFGQGIRTERFQDREVVSQEIIVKFRGATNARAVGQSLRAQDPDIASSTPVGRQGALRLRSRGRDVSALMEAYSRRSDVEYAEPNFIWHATDVPNDPLFNQQWALQNTGQVSGQTGTIGADIGAVSAWDVTEGSKQIVVGMLDTGIDYNHVDLAANIWSAPAAFSVTVSGATINCPAGSHGFNAVTRSCDPMDDDGHGTFTAGIAGAVGNNGHTLSGVSRVANIMALKFLSAQGIGTSADVIAAIEFAVQTKQRFPAEANIRVLNASFGGDAFSQALLNEINFAASRDMLFVAAAGNGNQDLDATPDYPASYNAANVITVAATDNRDQRASFSNYGAASVDLAAPGVKVLSTWRQNFFLPKDGTSASAAMLSGAAALVLSACSLNTQQLKAVLMDGVDAVPSMAGITVTGGRVNVNKSVRACAGAQATFTLTATPPGQTIALGHLAEFTLPVTPLNGFSDPVTFEVLNMPPGMSAAFSPDTLTSGSWTLNVTTDSSVPTGTYPLTIVATSGDVRRTTGVVVTSGLPGSCSLVADTGSVQAPSGVLFPTDAASIHRPGSFAKYCQLTVVGERSLTMRMGAAFDSYFYVLSNTGDIIKSSDIFVSGDPALQVVLPAGVYFLEETSKSPGAWGNYSVFINIDPPTLTSFSPTSGVQGTSVNITFTGSKFIGEPFQVLVTGCPGAVVSNIVVLDSTMATATLSLPNIVQACSIGVSTPGGGSGTRFFQILPLPPTITSVSPNYGIQGQTIPVTITGTNFVGVSVSLRSPQNFSIPLNIRGVTPTTITLDLSILLTFTPGAYSFVVTTSGGTSNAVPFTIGLAPPTLIAVFPGASGPGLSVDVTLSGTSFGLPLQIDAGPNITVSNINIVSLGQVRATFTISPNAALGDYPITVSTDAGTTQAVTFKLIPPPHITSLTPTRAFLGKTTTVVLTGTDFYCNVNVTMDTSTGVFPSNPGPCTSTSVTILVQVLGTAPLGPRTLTISGPNGTSNPVTINVVPVPAIISGITPTIGGQGSSVVVTVSGSDMSGGIVNVSGTGVQVSTLNSTATSLTASLAIASNASIGPRDLTVTNANGVSDPVTFTVTPPTWPDLTVAHAIPSLQGSQANEKYVITVRNVGTDRTASPITVLNTWASANTLVSYNGSGWTCSQSGIRAAACTYANSIAVNGESTLELTVLMAAVSGGALSDVEVSSVEDYNSSNNHAIATGQIVFAALPTITISPTGLVPGQQATIALTTSSPYPHDIEGTVNAVSLSFAPSIPGTPMDPAVQFATGGQTVSYVIRAFSTTAEFQGKSGPLGFQPGTVAGTLTFTLSFKPTPASPTRSTSQSAFVPQQPPKISAVTTTKTATGFVVALTLLATTRAVTSATFQFNGTTPLTLGCGGLSGCFAAGSSITFNVASLFGAWYASNPPYGSLATMEVPFNIQGNISGSVSVTLSNMLGTSNTMSFSLP